MFYTSILLPIFFFVFIYILQRPPYGTFHFSAISGSATIQYKDPYTIPYITGNTREAVYFALGFAHAADRLFALHLYRASAYGRLSEVNLNFVIDFWKRYNWN